MTAEHPTDEQIEKTYYDVFRSMTNPDPDDFDVCVEFVNARQRKALRAVFEAGKAAASSKRAIAVPPELLKRLVKIADAHSPLPGDDPYVVDEARALLDTEGGQ